MSETKRLATLLVDDHALVRTGLRRVLETVAEVGAITEAGSVGEAIAALTSKPFDLVLLDLNLPDADGFEVLRHVRTQQLTARVLILSMHAEPLWVQRAIQEGADGYLVKDLAVQEIQEAVRAVARGGAFFSASAQSAIAAATRGASDDRLSKLSAREREVLIDVARGLPNKAIAAKRHISARTVETHRANLMRKLGLHSVAELTRFALQHGLLGPESDPQ